MKRDFPFRHDFPLSKAARSAPPPDVTIIIGSDVAKPEEYRQAAQAEGLDLELVIPSAHGAHAHAAISALRQQGRLGSYCVLDAHGGIADGQHFLAFPHGSVNTLDLLRHIRAGRQCQETMIHLHSCYGAHVRDALRTETGTHLICGGKKVVLSQLGRNTVIDVMRLLGEKKRNPDAAPITPQAIFNRARQHMGDTVTLVGKDVGCHVRYAKLPGDLVGAGLAKIEGALATRINHGNQALVGALLDSYPWLLDGMPHFGASALQLAWFKGKSEIFTELVRREANWDRDIALMVPVAVTMPDLLPALAVALGKSAARFLALHAGQRTASPDQHALDCGMMLFRQLVIKLDLRPIDGVRALCDDVELADMPELGVLRDLFRHLSQHLCRQAGCAVAQEPDFKARLARLCCLAIFNHLSAAGMAIGMRRCLDAGSLHGLLLVIRRFEQLFPNDKSPRAHKWMGSVEALANQHLVSVLRLAERREVLCGMLYCLGETSHAPMRAMQAVWETKCPSWQRRHQEERPGADVNEFLKDVVENAIHSLATMLPAAEQEAYRATLTKDGGAPSDASLALLRGLLRDCEPAAGNNAPSLLPLALSTAPAPASNPAALALD